MALTIFLIVGPIVTILVFWRSRPKSNRPKDDDQTDFLDQLEDDQTPPWGDSDDDKSNS